MEFPSIVEKIEESIARRIKTYPHPTNRASEAGHPCVRYLVLSRLEGDKKALHDVGLQKIFDEGNLHEGAVLRQVQDAGFNLSEQQRPFEWKKFQLAGRIDSCVGYNGWSIPLEIKSCSPNVFPTIKAMDAKDMVKSKYPWVRKYPAQILLYMLMSGSDTGVMIFKNKTNGDECEKFFTLDDENLKYVESILGKLEKVNEYVARNEVPPLEPCDDCKGCGFAKSICFPGQDYGPGFDFITDGEVEAKLIRWEGLRTASKEFEELDKELKEHFKGKAAIIGDFKVESKSFERDYYDVPKDVKSAYAVKKQYFVTTIERL